VLLVGRLESVTASRSGTGTDDCLLRLAVPRRQPGGGPEPGVSYLDVTVPWPQARACRVLRSGDLIGVAGMLDTGGQSAPAGYPGIVADLVERLNGPRAPRP
jgi:hypothetical protein